MKKLLICLLFCLSWWQTVRPNPGDGGFVLVMTDGRNLTTTASSYNLEPLQKGNGCVALPVYWSSDLTDLSYNQLPKIGAIERGCEQHVNPWVYSLIFLDPVNIESITLLDRGGLYLQNPKRYDRKRLLELANLPMNYGEPVVEIPKDPEPPVIPPKEEIKHNFVLFSKERTIGFDAKEGVIKDGAFLVSFTDEKDYNSVLAEAEMKGYNISFVNPAEAGKLKRVVAVLSANQLYMINFSLNEIEEIYQDDQMIYNVPIAKEPVVDEPIACRRDKHPIDTTGKRPPHIPFAV